MFYAILDLPTNNRYSQQALIKLAKAGADHTVYGSCVEMRSESPCVLEYFKNIMREEGFMSSETFESKTEVQLVTNDKDFIDYVRTRDGINLIYNRYTTTIAGSFDCLKRAILEADKSAMLQSIQSR